MFELTVNIMNILVTVISIIVTIMSMEQTGKDKKEHYIRGLLFALLTFLDKRNKRK